MSKLVYGVGVNDSDYNVKVNSSSAVGKSTSFRCEYYDRWINMLRRCYSDKNLIKHPTYQGCEVCKEWLTFSNFKKWMEVQNWKGNSLDKDILGNGKIYSPTTCVFVPTYINCFIMDSSTKKKGKLLGVTLNNGKFMASFRFKRKSYYLGYFQTEKEAHEAWRLAKLEVLQNIKTELDNLHPKLYNRLTNYYITREYMMGVTGESEEDVEDLL